MPLPTLSTENLVFMVDRDDVEAYIQEMPGTTLVRPLLIERPRASNYPFDPRLAELEAFIEYTEEQLAHFTKLAGVALPSYQFGLLPAEGVEVAAQQTQQQGIEYAYQNLCFNARTNWDILSGSFFLGCEIAIIEPVPTSETDPSIDSQFKSQLQTAHTTYFGEQHEAGNFALYDLSRPSQCVYGNPRQESGVDPTHYLVDIEPRYRFA